MNLSEISIRRPVAISMVVVGILLLGFVSLEKIPLNLLPDITYPKITIRTEYPHAAPREVEERVTKFVESSVGIINNVVKVSSVSRPGWSDVYVEFKWGSDIDVISMDIREKLQLLENFLPEEVERPILLRYDPNQDPILTLAVNGDMGLSELRRWVEMNVELELERIDGVAAVKVEGGYEDEIVVDLDEERLASYGITTATVVERLKRENLNIASGSIEEGGSKIAVRTLNRFENLDDIKNVIVADKSQSGAGAIASAVSTPSAPSGGGGMTGMSGMGGGLGGLGGLLAGLSGLSAASSTSSTSPAARQAVIRLKDVAQVDFRHKERTEIARLEGRECIKVSIFKEGDANIVTVARAVHQAVDSIKEEHRAEPRSEEWTRKLRSPGRKLRIVGNAVSNVLLNYRPFTIEEEPIGMEHGVNIKVISDQSVFITQAIYSVAQSAVWGSMIAVFVLYVFLRNVSSTLIVGLAIPISIITTFNLMFFKNITFNIMSLGGLALGVGILVDNSIVVIENIIRRRTFEPDPRISAERGAREVGGAITAATLTNIIVFLPILYLEGMFRQIFGDLAWTVAFSTISSEVVALSLVPMLTVIMGKWVRFPQELLDDLDLPPEVREKMRRERDAELKRMEEETRQSAAAPPETPAGNPLKYVNHRARREHELLVQGKKPGFLFMITTVLSFSVFVPLLLWAKALKKIGSGGAGLFDLVMKYPLNYFDAGFAKLKRWYPALLRRLLRRPYLVAGTGLTLSACSVLTIYLLGWELLPTVDQGEFRVRAEFPTGTPIDEANRRISVLEKKIRSIPGADQWITSVFATVGIGTAEGEGTSEKAENLGEFHVALVDWTKRDVSDEQIIADAMKSIGDEVNLVARSAKPQLLSYKTPVEIELEGADLNLLQASAIQVMQKIEQVPGLQEIESSMTELNPEVNITIDRTRASALGLSVSQITDVIQRKIKGEIATRFDLPSQQLDILVQLEKKDRATFERLKRITIPGARGDIRLEQVAAIKAGLGPATITRSGNSRVAVINANIHGRPLGDVVHDITAVLGRTNLPPGITWRITGQNEEMQRSLPSLYLAVALALALVYIVLAAQFESLVHPFIIMFAVPFAMVGLTIILLITGQTINMFSLIGMLMMIGIAVNDAIVFVSTINQRRDDGMQRRDAIVEAGRSRLRPILITTFTTVFGMVPMAFVLGPGAELRAPMAITVIGGLLSSTVFTLMFVPSVYLMFDRIMPRSYHPHRPELTEQCEEQGPAAGGTDAPGPASS